MASKLAPGGIFVTQSGPCGLYSANEVCAPVYNTLTAVFKNTTLYHVHCPAFFDHYGFTMASNDTETDLLKTADAMKLIDERVDASHEIDASPEDVGIKVVRSLDADTVQSLFLWPKWLKDTIANNKIINKDASPAYLS